MLTLTALPEQQQCWHWLQLPEQQQCWHFWRLLCG